MNDRVFTARLVTTAPLHPGSGDAGLATDLPILRDSRGCPYIPGTQLAGRLREIATRLAPALGWGACSALTPPSTPGHAPEPAGEERKGPCACPVCRAFGSRDQERGEDPHDAAGVAMARARASRIWCFDAPLEGGGPGRVLVRDGVGIDRATGASAAEARALYDAEWIPTGSAFTLRVELEHEPDEEPFPSAEQALAVALSEWAAGRGRVGGGAARGGGAFELEECEFRRADVCSPSALVAFLRQPVSRLRGEIVPRWCSETVEAVGSRVPLGAEKDVENETGAGDWSSGAVSRFAELSFVLAFDGPLQVNDPAAALANALSFAPVFASAYWADPVLPGSSVRGVLRSQVERISRTLATRAAGGEPARFAAACGACDPFRSYPSDAVAPALVSCAAREGRAEKTCKAGTPAAGADASSTPELCTGCELFGSTVQGSRLWIADARIDGAAEYRLRDFVAIDRFTGGALEHAKFDALPLHSPRFRVSLLLWQHAKGELGALSLALRDVHDGLATFGAHGSRGFGRANVVDVSLSVGRVERRPERDVREEDWSGVFHCERSAFVDAEALVKAAREKGWVEAFVSRSQEPRKKPSDAGEPSDTYFGVHTTAGPTLAELYPAVVDLSRLEAAHG